MAQTKKFPGVVSSKETFQNIKSRQGSKKSKKVEDKWSQYSKNGEIREMLTNSSKTSKPDNKIDEKFIRLPKIRNKSQTQPGLKQDNEDSQNNVYNSHRPDSTLNSLHNDLNSMAKIRSRSKPMKAGFASGTDLRNKYQALRSKQKVKLYKGVQNEVINKDIEKRLKLASKSPKRQNYLGLDVKTEFQEEQDVILFLRYLDVLTVRLSMRRGVCRIRNLWI
jgi:acyl carrier protein phosphodiesterase